MHEITEAEHGVMPLALNSTEGLGCNARTLTKERPILFSAPMVRALLTGAKTQTRRAMRAQPHDGAEVVADIINKIVIDRHGEEQPGPDQWGAWWSDGEEAISSPYGGPGDRLWVREAWRAGSDFDGQPPRDIAEGARVWYEADSGLSGLRGLPRQGRLRPGMFMPRWASRVVLTLKHVRAERLNDISRGDAMEEGCPFPNMAKGPDPRQWYVGLWEQINGPGSWTANPWVWVVEFRRCGNLQPNVGAKRQ